MTRKTAFCDEIVPNLYLGSQDAFFEELPRLSREFGVGAVLRALPLPTDSKSKARFDSAWQLAGLTRGTHSFLAIEIEDDEDEDIFPHLEPVIRWIDERLSKNVSVLVHCAAGVSRSASFVVAYVAKKHNVDVETALDMTRAKRARVGPNSGFLKALKEFNASVLGFKSLLDVNIVNRWAFRYPRLSYQKLRELYHDAIALRKKEAGAQTTGTAAAAAASTENNKKEEDDDDGGGASTAEAVEAVSGLPFQNVSPEMRERIAVDKVFVRLAAAAMEATLVPPQPEQLHQMFE